MFTHLSQTSATMIRSSENDSLVICEGTTSLRYERIPSVRPGEDLLELFEIESLTATWLEQPIDPSNLDL